MLNKHLCTIANNPGQIKIEIYLTVGWESQTLER